MQDVGSHSDHDPLHGLRDVAVADQSHGAAADVTHGLAEARIRRPALAAARGAVELGEPAQRSKHQQHGALGDRGGIGAGHVGHGDPQPRRGVDVDGVDARAELVHEPTPLRLLEVCTRDRPQHVPDHLGVGEFGIERVVVILGAVVDIEPIRFWCNELRDLVAGNVVREDS